MALEIGDAIAQQSGRYGHVWFRFRVSHLFIE